MVVGFAVAVRSHVHKGMAQDIEFLVLYGPLTTDKQQGEAIIQHTHFVRHEKFTPAVLVVGTVIAIAPGGFSERVCIQSFFSKQLRYILVGTLLIATQIEKFVAVAANALPLLFKQSL